MKLVARISKLESGRRPTRVDYDFSKLDEEELRLIAALPFNQEGSVDPARCSSADLEKLGCIIITLDEQQTG